MMRCTHCEKCCRDTQMELCEADVARLERAGHQREEFSRLGADNVKRLRNTDGFCVFYDRERRRCREYERRPLGCVIYPVNVSVEGEVMVDELCPEADTVTDRELEIKGKRLRMLLDTVSAEARRSCGTP